MSKDKSKNVLLVCLGATQLLLLKKIIAHKCSSYKNICLLIYWKSARIRDLNKLSIKAESLGCFSKIHYEPLLMDPDHIRSLRSSDEFACWKMLIKNRLGNINYDEIILPKLFHPPEKALAEAFPKASLVLFEDGLRARIDMPIFRKTKSRYRRITSPGISGEHISRIIRSYYNTRLGSLPNYAKKQAVFFPKLDSGIGFSSEKIHYLTEKLKKEANNHKTCLILTQNLAFAGFCTEDEEISMYSDIVKYVKGKGYTALLKFHPRDESKFRVKLKQSVQECEILNDDVLTAEQLILKQKPQIVVGIISTALIYCIDYDLCEAYTVVGTNLLGKNIKWDKDHLNICKLISSYVPPVSFAAG